MNKKRGFTLLELLVVIAIISIMTGLVIAGINEVRMKARDARRKSDFSQIKKALDLYYDKYEHYVSTGSNINCPGSNCQTNPAKSGNYANSKNDIGSTSWLTLFQPLVDEEFMPTVFRDPINIPNGQFPWGGSQDSHNRLYHYRSNGNVYLLCTWLENTDDPTRLQVVDVTNPFVPSRKLFRDDGYSAYNYCVTN